MIQPVRLTMAALLLGSTVAGAHFDIERNGVFKVRNGRYNIKNGPCGVVPEADKRSANVYTFAPGETIEIGVSEYIPHPGYYRVAFDTEGTDDFVNPQSVLPLNRECMDTPEDRCGKTDFYNNDTVLADNLFPTGSPRRRDITLKVTLPEVECDQCVLQVIQVMTDAPGIHAPYDPSPTSDDLYYQCIDMRLAWP